MRVDELDMRLSAIITERMVIIQSIFSFAQAPDVCVGRQATEIALAQNVSRKVAVSSVCGVFS